jgi:hypothetical protein
MMSFTDEFLLRDDMVDDSDDEPEECELCGDEFGTHGVFNLDGTRVCVACYELESDYVPDYSDELPEIEVSEEEMDQLEELFDKDYSDEDLNAIYDEAFPDGK